MDKLYIKDLEDYIKIENKYSGGNIRILYENEDLSSFSKKKGRGFFELTDCVIYELNKYKDILGTYKSLNMTLEEYSNILRNIVEPGPYREFGFISLQSMKGYLERLFDKRRLELDIFIERSPVSLKFPEEKIRNILSENHVIIMQSKLEEKYFLVLGIEGEDLIISSNGNISREKVSSIYEFDDKYFGFLYIDFKV